MSTPADVASRRGLSAGLSLMVLAVVVPAATGWRVHSKEPERGTFRPLSATWEPKVGLASLVVVAIALLAWRFGFLLAERMRWGRLLGATYATTLVWLLSLALVEGTAGISKVLGDPDEYLRTARATSDVGALLRHWIARMPEHATASLPTHVAGHPPGALLFFVCLVRLGLGGDFTAGLVVVALASTTPVAVLLTLRRLGSETAVRRALPFLVLAPAAVWMAVSADALFGAVAAWGLCCLAFSASTRGLQLAGWATLSGLLLGWCVLMSYGLPLLGFLAVGILVCARSWRPLPLTALAALAVVATLALVGFRLWDAYPAIHDRYWEGIARTRPASYWLWGDLAALLFSAGPAVAAGLGALIAAGRTSDRTVRWLVLGASSAVLIADASLMSKAEVERIWLPFVPWLLLATALVPDHWRRRLLVFQVVLAIAIEHLLATTW